MCRKVVSFIILIMTLIPLENTYSENIEPRYIMENGTLIEYSVSNTNEVFTIPEGCVVVGKYAFSGNESIKKVIFPDTVKYIESFAFENCPNLEQIEFSDAIVYIGSSAFSDCIKLKDIELPGSLEYIGDNAFAWCFEIDKIMIPNGTKYIGNGAFSETNAIVVLSNPSIKFMIDTFDGATYVWENNYLNDLSSIE